jgi:RNA polymerase sigma factor (sigma-70 family)
MRAASLPPTAATSGPLRSRRLLALAGDGRLVEQIQRGNEAAFEVVFERHGAAILGFCRHMLRSTEEAEDAVQHTFAAAYRDLRLGDDREIALKPWLFAIARNRCMSLLRARREQPVGEPATVAAGHPAASAPPIVPTAPLAEQVEQRGELRDLVADLRELPVEQRAALLLTELGDLSHTEVAGVLGCEVPRVKALVFRARSQLIARREARETPCELIREQLANLRGGALRRTELRLHLRGCPGCRAFREQVRQQRRMLAAALPVAPTLGLKSSVLAAIGFGAGSGGGAATVAGTFGGATVAKIAVAGALAGGGIVAGEAVVDSGRSGVGRPAPVHAEPDAAAGGENAPVRVLPRASGGGTPAVPPGTTRAAGRERRGKSTGGEAKPGRARGPITAPPLAPPVRRGPPEKLDRPGKSSAAGKGKSKRNAGGKAKATAPPKADAGPAPQGRGHARARGPKAGVAPEQFRKAGARPAPGPGSGAPSRRPRGNAGARSSPKPKTGAGYGARPKPPAESPPQPKLGKQPPTGAK